MDKRGCNSEVECQPSKLFVESSILSTRSTNLGKKKMASSEDSFSYIREILRNEPASADDEGMKRVTIAMVDVLEQFTKDVSSIAKSLEVLAQKALV